MFEKALAAFLAVLAISFLSFIYPILAAPLLAAAGIAAFWLALRKPEWGIYILFGELFIGSRGHLLEHGPVSLRLVVFAAVFLAWLICRIKNKEWRIKGLPRSYWVLLIILGFAVLKGFLNANGFTNIFYDANGYLYLLALPVVLDAVRDRKTIDNLLEILAAAIVAIAAQGLFLYVWFAFALPGVAAAYHWVINFDLGEITGEVGSASRIFLASQFWPLVGLFVFSLRGRPRWGIVAAAAFSVVLSLSRSFWLGGAAAAAFAGAVALYQGFRGNWTYLKNALKKGMAVFLLLALAGGAVWALGRLAGGVSAAVGSRTANPTTEAAGSARLLLLPELISKISDSMVFGSGFGAEITYKSFLPDRVTKQNPDGEITTYAFEWGYLDAWLKLGFLGLIIYLLFIAHVFGRGWRAMQIQSASALADKVQNLGILGAFVALIVLNNTTPYLNHPLGIGFLILSYVSFKILDFEL